MDLTKHITTLLLRSRVKRKLIFSQYSEIVSYFSGTLSVTFLRCPVTTHLSSIHTLNLRKLYIKSSKSCIYMKSSNVQKAVRQVFQKQDIKSSESSIIEYAESHPHAFYRNSFELLIQISVPKGRQILTFTHVFFTTLPVIK